MEILVSLCDCAKLTILERIREEARMAWDMCDWNGLVGDHADFLQLADRWSKANKELDLFKKSLNRS